MIIIPPINIDREQLKTEEKANNLTPIGVQPESYDFTFSNPAEEVSQEINIDVPAEEMSINIDQIDVLPAEEVELINTFIGPDSTSQAAFLSGLNENFTFNLAREIRASRDYKDLNSFWNTRFYYGDNPLTEDKVETGFNTMTAYDMTGVDEQTWEGMSFEDRLKTLKGRTDEWIEKEYNPDTDSARYMAGKFIGFFTDPTTAVPLKGPAQAAAYGAVDLSLWEHSTTGELSPTTPLKGAVFSYAGYKGIEKGSNILKTRAANKVVNEIQNEMVRIHGTSATERTSLDIFREAKQNLGLTDDYVDEILKQSSTKLHTPSMKESRIILQEKSMKTIMPGSKTGPGKYMDYLIEPISEQIKRLSPGMYGKLMSFQREHFEKSHFYASMVDPFLKKAFTRKMNKTSKAGLTVEEQKELHRLLLNAESPVQVGNIKKFLKEKGGDSLVKDYDLYREAFRLIHGDRVAAGNKDLGKLVGYSPRYVKSYYDWYNNAPKVQRDAILAMAKKEDPEIKSISQLDEQVLGKYVEKYLSGKKRTYKELGSNKERTVGILEKGQQSAYLDPIHAAHKNIKESMEEVERFRVFGSPKEKESIEGSISRFLSRELKAKRIKPKDIPELRELLMARYINSAKQGPQFIKNFKDISYMTLLGHPSNAVRQLGDLVFSAYENNIKNTARASWNSFYTGFRNIIEKEAADGSATAKKLLGSVFKNKGMMSPKQQGFMDNIAEEFANDTATKRILDNVFKYSGFRSVDALGKGTLMNSTLLNLAGKVKTPKGRQEILDEWFSILGPEKAGKLMDDLKGYKPGKPISAEMRDIAFAKASKFQPLSLLEMPKAYLNSPNGRFMYMLKTFTVKHLNVMRQDIFKLMRNGNLPQAMRNFAYLIPFFTAGNMAVDRINDWMFMREPKNFEESFWANLLRNTGFFSKYDYDNLGREGVIDTTWKAIQPPFSPLYEGGEVIVKGAMNMVEGENWAEGQGKDPKGKVLQNLPFVGRILQNWFKE